MECWRLWLTASDWSMQHNIPVATSSVVVIVSQMADGNIAKETEATTVVIQCMYPISLVHEDTPAVLGYD